MANKLMMKRGEEEEARKGKRWEWISQLCNLRSSSHSQFRHCCWRHFGPQWDRRV